jgi:hypothetical protein
MIYETYNVTVRVAGVEDGHEDVVLTVKMPGIKRSDIMAEGYPENIRLLVDQLDTWTGPQESEEITP